jgi:hypothetical protein
MEFQKFTASTSAVVPTVVSVRSAELSLISALPGLSGRSLSLAYAGTDARALITAAARGTRGRDDVLVGGIGLAGTAEGTWREEIAVTRDERPSFVAQCEQMQVNGAAMAPFAGIHGYPSWRNRT